MGLENTLLAIAGTFIVVSCLILIALKVPKRLKADYFGDRWKELQTFCKDKKKWPEALQEADRLLDRALKKRKFKGKSMGERMVSAQRTFTDNDGAWFAHNLNKKLKADPNFKLKESDVKDALIGFRQALRDIGALPDNVKSRD
jgi:hypothetical protein